MRFFIRNAGSQQMIVVAVTGKEDIILHYGSRDEIKAKFVEYVQDRNKLMAQLAF